MGNCCITMRDVYHQHKLTEASDAIAAYSLNGLKCYAKLVKVYDGDTFKACIFHANEIKKITFRPLGYDTPELRPPKIIPNRESHVELAKEARKHFIHLCGGEFAYVFVHCYHNDKYGRVLVNVFKNRYSMKSINDMMLESKYAKPYDGKTKIKFIL